MPYLSVTLVEPIASRADKIERTKFITPLARPESFFHGSMKSELEADARAKVVLRRSTRAGKQRCRGREMPEEQQVGEQ